MRRFVLIVTLLIAVVGAAIFVHRESGSTKPVDRAVLKAAVENRALKVREKCSLDTTFKFRVTFLAKAKEQKSLLQWNQLLDKELAKQLRDC